MASHRLKRSMRGTLATTAVVAAVSLVASPATANPDTPAPKTASEALDQYHKLTGRAEKLQEKYLKAKTDLTARQADLKKAKIDLKRADKVQQQAKNVENEYRGQVDQLSDASLKGARFNKLSALLTGESKKDFLERASALDVLAADSNEALHRLGGATKKATTAKNRAEDAKRRASNATNAANKLIDEIRKQNKNLQDKIAQVKDALARLSPQDRSILSDPGDLGVYIAPAGAAGIAMDAALAERGKPYVWGASGPSSYDCSGLMMYAYGRAGLSLPHSSQAQSAMGQAVSRDALQPGDLVFFGSPVHHVGMYVGDGMMVDASTEGVPVRVEPLQSDYAGARRLAG